MGKVIKAKCRLCDFEIDFKYGGSRFDYQENCPVPAISLESKCFENVNYITHKNNPSYLFYSDNELKGDNGDRNTHKNFDLELNQVNNFCPNCKQFSFDFTVKTFY